ncbi:MAG TPA: bifunctional 2-polyprenyl-6-hydroxyphenol methylase/3-demethylubiquinol 3-O-methyltransferase UbiG [Polyangia bacterium]|jgi:2-polyprenyl-6-hydroxyphenyl methylase/3-demethylubiquinone-9 3-methyltransferase|nr:bifunctional 2-polyprenyl-6-hydroxyphenol methylase/3-demethylubiquinol 3-O-methyltransferase UbiG [Polyangia bacterium]
MPLAPISRVNNEIYAALGELWYTAEDAPVALLRAESRLLNPWVAAEVTSKLGERRCQILDVGCGAGFLANHLASLGHEVTGLDASDDALAVAARHDSGHTVRYQKGDALKLPFDDASFDVVCAMDFLEHLETPERAIAEASRVLRPSGLFFFHTFNRNLWAWLVIIKGVEWFVPNTPPRLHVLRLFLKPAEVAIMCRAHGLGAVELRGMRPRLGWPFWRMLLSRSVSARFAFKFTRSLQLGFSGCARRDSGIPLPFTDRFSA